MKKRIVSFVLAITILVAVLPTTAFAANLTSFRDVASTAWYHDAVDYVSRKGIMSGVGNNTFSPETTLTRAQLCQILYNIEKKPHTSSGSFSDVSASAWYSGAVNWAAAQGIVNGTGNGLFSPDNPISREQMVTILYRYATYKNYNLSVLVSLSDYSDANLLSSWAEDAMQWAVSEGIISGTTSTTISPQGTATRAQAATMLMRFCQRMEAKQAFYAKDIKDFGGETVINFDTSNETNFAVLVEDAVASESHGLTNQIVSADEDEGIYVFSHIDQTISSLTPGDVLYLTYGTGADDYLLLKVGGIEISGNTATVTEGKAELSDYFQYIDVDMEVDISEAGNTVARRQGNNTPAMLAFAQDAQSQSWSDVVRAPSVLADSMTGSAAMDFKLGYKDDVFSLTGNVKFTLKIKISYDKTILDLGEISFSVKQETSLNGEISKAAKGSYKKETPAASIPITAGVDAELAAYFKFEVSASATGSLSGTIITESGTRYSGGKAQPIKESDADLSLSVGGSFNVSTGVGVTGSVKVIKVLKLSLSGEAGVELDGRSEQIIASTQKDEKHLCTACVDGTVDVYFELKFDAKLGISEKYSLKLVDWKLAKAKIEFAKFYISFLGGSSPVEFGWGTCPHKQYLVTVVAMDQFGNKLANAKIFLTNNGTSTHPVPEGVTGTDGTYKVYCDNGNYSVTGYGPDGYQDASETVKVSGKTQAVTLVMDKKAVSTGVMTCDIHHYYDESSTFGTATMKILSDKKAVFSMDLIDPDGYFNMYAIYFGTWNLPKNWTNEFDWMNESLFSTGGNTYHLIPEGSAERNSDWKDQDSFTVGDWITDWQEQQGQKVSWTVTASNAGDFSFYDLEGTTMVALVEQISRW